MQNLKHPITIRNRVITNRELETIRQAIANHWDSGRSAISHILCEQWNWRQANGQLKGMACRELLLRLERRGHIQLPPRINNKNNAIKVAALPECYQLFNVQPITGRVDSFKNLRLEIVANKKAGRVNNDETILFIALGMGGDYVALFSFLYETAKRRGLGHRLKYLD